MKIAKGDVEFASILKARPIRDAKRSSSAPISTSPVDRASRCEYHLTSLHLQRFRGASWRHLPQCVSCPDAKDRHDQDQSTDAC